MCAKRIILPNGVENMDDIIFPSGFPGMLRGEFSVGKNEKIHFSRGNLQYRPSTHEWRFALNQWESATEDCIIESNQDRTSFYPKDYKGWEGLFHAPNDNDYYWEVDDFKDNGIINGGSKPSAWRMMSPDEWNFLFKDRENANKLYGLGTVCGVKGLIVLPDGWDFNLLPSFNPFSDESRYSDNEFGWDWDEMELLGAVFLPVFRALDARKKIPILARGRYFSKDIYLPTMILVVTLSFHEKKTNFGKAAYIDVAYLDEFDSSSSEFEYGMVRLVR